MMESRIKFALAAIAIGMIPAAIVLYEFFLRPVGAQGSVTITARLWYTLCVFTPGLVPLLSSFVKHHWPEGFVFGVFVVLSNVVTYGLCGALLSLTLKKSTHADRAASPHA